MIWQINEKGQALATVEQFLKVHPDFRGETEGVSYVVNYDETSQATVRYPVKFIKAIKE